MAIARRHGDSRCHLARICRCDPAGARVGTRTRLVILGLGIAARMFNLMVKVAGRVAASRDEGGGGADEDFPAGRCERGAPGHPPFFLGPVWGEPLETKLIWVC